MLHTPKWHCPRGSQTSIRPQSCICRLYWPKPGTKSGTHKTFSHQDNFLGGQIGITSFSNACLFIITSTDLTRQSYLATLCFIQKVSYLFLLQPDNHSLIYSKRIYRRDRLTNLKSFTDIWKCGKCLIHRWSEEPPNMALRKQNQTSKSHFEATTVLFRGLTDCWSTGSRGPEKPMLDAGVNSCLVNNLLFITTDFWRIFALSLQNPWVRWFGGKIQLTRKKKRYFSNMFYAVAQSTLLPTV